MTVALRVVRKVGEIPGKNVFGPGAYSDLLSSDDTAEKPIVAGIWNLQDISEPTPPWDAEWDEVKYVVKGSLTLKDEHTGREYDAEAGDFIWFPTGGRTSIIRSTGVTTLYVEQRHGDPEIDSPRLHDFLSRKLEGLVHWYTKSNPKSAAEATQAALVLPGGNTRSVLHNTPFPLVIESGHDTVVKTKDGTEYIDFVSEYSAGMFGHSHPKIHDAVQVALRTGIHLGGVNGKEAELAGMIQARFSSMELMRFANSGTEANTLALGAALAYTGQKKILVFNNGYHGGTITFPDGKNPPMNLPHQFLIGTYNDIEATRSLLHYGIGAILVEPLQSAGGIIPATREFLQFLREAASTLNAVLIFDEVVTSRLNYHGLQGYHDIRPDMTTLGKYIGGGFSFGCFGGKSDIMRLFDPYQPNALGHSGTFNNNIFTMTAGIAGMKLVTKEEIARTNALGNRLREGINERAQAASLGNVIKAVGFGSMVGVRFSGTSGGLMRDVFYFDLLKRHISVGRRGFIALNLMHEDSHIDQLLSAVTGILSTISSQLDEAEVKADDKQ